MSAEPLELKCGSRFGLLIFVRTQDSQFLCYCLMCRREVLVSQLLADQAVQQACARCYNRQLAEPSAPSLSEDEVSAIKAFILKREQARSAAAAKQPAESITNQLEL
jgi:hypothetical protein